jgi:hypothetical protein
MNKCPRLVYDISFVSLFIGDILFCFSDLNRD